MVTSVRRPSFLTRSERSWAVLRRAIAGRRGLMVIVDNEVLLCAPFGEASW
jgi:hypothetical protein